MSAARRMVWTRTAPFSGRLGVSMCLLARCGNELIDGADGGVRLRRLYQAGCAGVAACPCPGGTALLSPDLHADQPPQADREPGQARDLHRLGRRPRLDRPSRARDPGAAGGRRAAHQGRRRPGPGRAARGAEAAALALIRLSVTGEVEQTGSKYTLATPGEGGP